MHSIGFTNPTKLPTSSNAQKRLLFGQELCSQVPRRYATSRKRYEIHCRRGSKGRERRFSDGRRPNRVSELIKREISPIIDDAYRRAFRGELQESPLLVSVVDVRCSDDLRHARVEVSVLGTDDQKENIMRWLKAARKELRVELAHRVYLKHTPELMFDESQMAQATNTVNILNRITAEKERKQSELGGVGQKGQRLDAYERDMFDQGLDLDASLDDAIIVDDMREEEEDDGDSEFIIDIEDADEDEDEDEGKDSGAGGPFTMGRNVSGGSYRA
ncbi:Ribosome-binding factor A [Gracilariopsis chorda]|uniref:Ribosome-binding factor A n=1 Tax=Gracilariopsis chorda TaxID=448386 RepID=A0A2V3J0D5_9FLOR|nr:Ribosome-binding factor A [Gracilariopsis chorda]|eukprot:PXF47809.1 Ribosome-binding factor A [Gracilariopsis chorda]